MPEICTGVIDSVQVEHNGKVALFSKEIYGDDAARVLCSSNADFGAISGAACDNMLAILLSAEARGKKITVQYKSVNCVDVQPWYEAQTPHALRIL
ncbi:hypothetical protein GCM10008940_02250 [Microbulbifer agarilyticus]